MIGVPRESPATATRRTLNAGNNNSVNAASAKPVQIHGQIIDLARVRTSGPTWNVACSTFARRLKT